MKLVVRLVRIEQTTYDYKAPQQLCQFGIPQTAIGLYLD